MDDYAQVAELYDHVDIYRHRPDVGFFVEEALAAGWLPADANWSRNPERCAAG